MDQTSGYKLEINSPTFCELCARLCSAVFDQNATWSIDLMAGAFAFSDEFPGGADEPLEIVLPYVTLRRLLTAYRVSLIAENPRSDLAPWWEATRRLAPDWPGFSPDRCGPAMKPMLQIIEARSAQFLADIDRLEEQLQSQQN